MGALKTATLKSRGRYATGRLTTYLFAHTVRQSVSVCFHPCCCSAENVVSVSGTSYDRPAAGYGSSQQKPVFRVGCSHHQSEGRRKTPAATYTCSN